MVLALRRNMGNGSAAALGAAILDDVSPQTVLKAEREAGAALRCSLRSYIKSEESAAASVYGKTISCVAFSSDATNSGVWQHSKLQACVVKAAYFQVRDLQPGRRFLECVSIKEGWSDLGVVLYSTTAGTHSLLLKQLRSVGCPTWLDKVGNGDGAMIRWFFYVSDGGPDQVGFAKHLIQQTSNRVQILAVVSRCYMHMLQLMFRSGLAVLDAWCKRYKKPWTFYSALTKLIHIWRDNARALFLTVLRNTDGATAMAHAKKSRRSV
jgi:hypothetical protein